MKPVSRVLFVLTIAAMLAGPVAASDEADFNRRAANRDVATFVALDRDGDGRLTWQDVRGDIDMQARFDDIDINRDGVIVASEIERYVRLQYGVAVTAQGLQQAAMSGGVGSQARAGTPR